jgi:hypothetical protein
MSEIVLVIGGEGLELTLWYCSASGSLWSLPAAHATAGLRMGYYSGSFGRGTQYPWCRWVAPHCPSFARDYVALPEQQ